ncbi:acetyl esterase/lipase [Pedobacter cryoconitis]|uniref:alpha/beta hydrolase n=1 Tax=Pedobacter cryoconitis TaxID=188932 RepID=UPI00182187CF|nr:alpha/beta hydrolase [Pedobacter cryoconitis]MBB6269907.1 acetyl esterase/lipase [Pedobacter cryoconitis]
MTVLKNILMLFAFLGQFSALSAKVKVEKNINYTDANDTYRQLDVFYQKDITQAKDVIVFIHGGSWSSGKKDTYWWLGRNLARKGVVTVNINYRLTPENKFERMAQDCAQAVKWVKDHVSKFGGNPDRIFLMGHSAGGHLAELINDDPVYFKQAGLVNPVKGVILNDAFGLDMKEYMTSAEKDNSYYDFLRSFSADPAIWEKGSPLHYVANSKNPHLIFYGAKTYPAIQLQSERLNKLLEIAHVPTELHVIPKKKHVGMISQMVFGSNKLYDLILNFLKRIE